MSDQTIRAALVAALKTVPGTGVIYDYDRYPALNEVGAFLALFRDEATKLIMGWELTRIGIPTIVRDANDIYKVTHSYQLKGYYSLQDAKASEKFFNTLVDAIIQKLIDIKVPNEQGLHIPKAPLIAHKMFGDTLCHYAEIQWPVSEIVTKTQAVYQDLLKIMLASYVQPLDALGLWQPGTAYQVGALVAPSAQNGHRYICTAAGVSNANEPVWPTNPGAAVQDGTVTWTEDGTIVADEIEIDIT